MTSPHHLLVRLSLLCTTAALLFAWSAVSNSQNETARPTGVDVLTQHNDNARTGLNSNETILTPDTVNQANFGKLFDKEVDGLIYAQPLVVTGIRLAGKVRNLVLVVTQHNSLYCFDADTGEQLWMRNFGMSVPIPNQPWNQPYGFYRDLTPEAGIISTPVIDRATNTIYLTHTIWDAKQLKAQQWLRAIDFVTQRDKFGSPVQVEGEVMLRNQDAIVVMPRHDLPMTMQFDPNQHLQRAGLLLNQGRVVLAYAGHFDKAPFQGWLFSYNATKLKSEAPMIWCSTAGGPLTSALMAAGGIWQGGMGLTADAQGNIYFTTGNGDFSEDLAKYGDSIVKLSARGSELQVASYFSPCNQECLEGQDADLAASGMLHIPGTNLLIGGGKQGRLYLVDTNDLGKFIGCGSSFDCANPNIRQEFQVGCDVAPAATPALDTPCTTPSLEPLMPPPNPRSSPCALSAQEIAETHHIHGSPVFWRSDKRGPVIYVWTENNILRAFPFDEKQGKFVSSLTDPAGNKAPITVKGCFDQKANPMEPWTMGQAKSPGYFAPAQPNQFAQLHQGMTGGILSISSNRGQGGIVWATTPTNNDANQKIVPGILRAYDADDLGHELWNSYQVRERDDFGNFAKHTPPTVANGKVYLATFSKHLSVYGLKPPRVNVQAINLLKDGDFEGNQTNASGSPWTGNFKVNDAYPYYESSQGTLCPDAQHDAMLSQVITAQATATYKLTAYCATNIQPGNVLASRFSRVTLGVSVNGNSLPAMRTSVTAYNGYQKYTIVFKASKQGQIKIWYYAPKVHPIPQAECGVIEKKQPANYAAIDAVSLVPAAPR